MPAVRLHPAAGGSMPEQHPEVAGFLSSLDNGQRERFLAACECRDSGIQTWMYASAMGYEGDFLQLEAWLQKRYPRLDRRKMLLAEAIKIESDIASLRDSDVLVGADQEGARPARPTDSARNIASLSKELRGHLVEVERMTKAVDRRGLLLTGADRLLRILQDMFAENDEMKAALEQGFEAFWSQMNDER